MLNVNKIILSKKHDKLLKCQRNFTHEEKNMYIKSIESQYNKYKEYLPKKCSNLLSIGCGLAVPELIFYEHYNNNINYYLFDKTLISENIYFGFENEASFYNNLDYVKEIYINYGIEEKNINLIEAKNENLENLPKMDIIISFVAWGFHFPLKTYLNNVIKLMAENTILIIDVRNIEKQHEEILKYFDIIDKKIGKKSVRYVLKLLK